MKARYSTLDLNLTKLDNIQPCHFLYHKQSKCIDKWCASWFVTSKRVFVWSVLSHGRTWLLQGNCCIVVYNFFEGFIIVHQGHPLLSHVQYTLRSARLWNISTISSVSFDTEQEHRHWQRVWNDSDSIALPSLIVHSYLNVVIDKCHILFEDPSFSVQFKVSWIFSVIFQDHIAG